MEFYYAFKRITFCFLTTLSLLRAMEEEKKPNDLFSINEGRESTRYKFPVDFMCEDLERMKTVLSLIDISEVNLPDDGFALADLINSLRGYLKMQQDKLSDMRPGGFEQSVDLLHAILGSMKFQRGRFAFGKDSIEIYNERIEEWQQLRDIGKPIFYSWFNVAVGEVCDSDENIKRFISAARKYFLNSEEYDRGAYANYNELLNKLPKSISDKIKQRYLFEELQDWVKKADHVLVTTSLKGSYKIPILNDTRIKSVKEALVYREGIPVLQQALYARLKASIWPFSSSKLIKIADNRYVKEVMDKYDTDTLELYLTLKPQITDDEDN